MGIFLKLTKLVELTQHRCLYRIAPHYLQGIGSKDTEETSKRYQNPEILMSLTKKKRSVYIEPIYIYITINTFNHFRASCNSQHSKDDMKIVGFPHCLGNNGSLYMLSIGIFHKYFYVQLIKFTVVEPMDRLTALIHFYHDILD